MRTVFYLKWRYQYCAGTDITVITYMCLTDLLAVEIGRYRTGTDINFFSYGSITQIAVMTNPGAIGSKHSRNQAMPVAAAPAIVVAT